MSHRSTAALRAARVFPSRPGQRGLATSAQLRAAGWTYSAMDHAMSTAWQSPFPGVFASHRGPLDHDTLLVAAAMWAGRDAVLTGLLALVRRGVTIADPGDAVFLVPSRCRARRVARDGRSVQVIRTRRPVVVTPGCREDIVAVAPTARALVDAMLHQAQAVGQGDHLAITVLQRGLCTPDELERELCGRPRGAVAEVLRGLQAFRDGAWSRPEAELRSVIEAEKDLPELSTNVTLITEDGVVLGIPDGYLESVGVVIQVHSRAHHQGVDAQGGNRWARTVERDSVYAGAGLLVVAVTPWTLYSAPQTFIRTLRQAVEQGRRRARPPVRMRPS